MPNDTILHILKQYKQELMQKYNFTYIGVFGSYTRGEENPASDVDILIEFSIIPTYFKFLELEEELEKILNKKVDLITKSGLKPLIKNKIIKETVYI